MTEIELIEKAVREVGIKSLLNHGAASCIYSEGCNGVTQDHLVALVRKIALHCAVALAAPSQPEGATGTTLSDRAPVPKAGAAGEAEPVAWQGRTLFPEPASLGWSKWRQIAETDMEAWCRRIAMHPDVYQMRALYAQPFQPAGAAAPKRCEYCDDTGDVHSIDGEWRGRCTCAAGAAAPDEGEVRRKALEEAAAECDELTWAIDIAGKRYKRPASADYCASRIRQLAALSAPKGEAATPSSQGGQP